MNIVNFLTSVPTPFLIAFLAANAIPYVSQLLTKFPGWWTGAATVALSLVTACIAALANDGADDWRKVLGVTVGAWVIARLHVATLIKGTEVETWLIEHGNSGSGGTATP